MSGNAAGGSWLARLSFGNDDLLAARAHLVAHLKRRQRRPLRPFFDEQLAQLNKLFMYRIAWAGALYSKLYRP